MLAILIASCSTLDESADDQPPVCSCAVGERTLDCDAGQFNAYNDQYTGLPASAEYQVFCIDENATEQEREDACLAKCGEWLGDVPAFYCDFFREDKFRWTGCVAPEEDPTAGAAGLECPGWYVPAKFVRDYHQPGTRWATVSITKPFLRDISTDIVTLYTCDSARYEESMGGHWTFVSVETSDLLHALGIRTGDRNATVQGIDPTTSSPVTPIYVLDSVESFHDAYSAFLNVAGVHLSVERANAAGGVFHVWITIEG